MKNSLKAGLILNTIICWTTSAKSVAKEAEIEVKLQFLEYELEDFCVSKNEALWKFLNGSDHDLKKFLDVELKESEFYKHELQVLQKHLSKKFSNKRLQRLADIFSHPGAPLLGNMEFKEYRDYSVKLQELIGTMEILCSVEETTQLHTDDNYSASVELCSRIDRKINELLYKEKKEENLRNLWTKWYTTLEGRNRKTKYDFVQQLSILDLEAEQNGEEELSEYWLKQGDITWVDYETATSFWQDILPLYEKLKHFITIFVRQSFGKNVQRDPKIIPSHVLGSLVTYDWVTAAEKLEAFATSDAYTSLRQSLRQKKPEDLYKAADNQTAELKLGHLPQSFYQQSRFNVTSQTCQHKVMNYCERENAVRAMFCANEVPSIRHYIEINENVMRLKYQLLCGKEEEENGYLFREGPRDSVLYEAVEGLSSLRALWPETLESQGLLTNHSQQQKTMLSLLITALHVIPPLPYYLATDLWRINALREIDASVSENTDTTTLPTFTSTLTAFKKDGGHSQKSESGEESSSPKTNTEEGSFVQGDYSFSESSKTYDTPNLTKDWWNYRKQYQGVDSPDGELYEDYLEDENIIWNKPYLSKFLAKILQFQILEKTVNLTADLARMHAMMRQGKSKSWESLVEETFNITEISVQPLLKYFKPLEEFLEKGNKFKNHTQLFSFDDLDFFSQGFSLNSINTDGQGEKPAEGSDALFLSFVAIAAVGIVAIIVTIGRKRYKRRRRARERKRRLAEL